MAVSRDRLLRARARLNSTLADLLRDIPPAAIAVSEVLDPLAEVETLARRRTRNLPLKHRRPMPRFARYSYGVEGYSIQRKGPKELLNEHRGPMDLRCPKEIYFAVAKVLADAPDQGLRWGEIERRLGDHLTGKPPASQPRIPVRFWLSLQPPLVIRFKLYVRPVNPIGFVDQAERAWRELEEQNFEQGKEE